MGRIVPPHAWKAIGLSQQCQNWTLDHAGAARKMSNRAAAYQTLAQATNHLLARRSRVLFHYCQDSSVADTTGAEPLLRWLYFDDWDNGREYTVHLVCIVPPIVTTAWYAQQWSGADNYDAANITPKNVFERILPLQWTDVWYLSFTVDRGNAGDAAVEDGLSTFDGCTILACTVIEGPLDELDTSVNFHCIPKYAAPGKQIVADAVYNVRTRSQERRMSGLPVVFCWAAQGCTETPAVPGDTTGRHVDSATYVNIFDQADTTRTATSVGWCTTARYAAHGLDTKVKVICRVLAEATVGNGTVRFEGSSNIANNYCEITVTGGGGLAWYGGINDYMYLDATIEQAVMDATMNKIDCLAKVASDDLYIYGVAGWIEYT
jgi:hypothetical protein